MLLHEDLPPHHLPRFDLRLSSCGWSGGHRRIRRTTCEWIWTGNTHANGTLEIAAGAKANIIHGNFTPSPIIEHGTETSLSGNIVRKKSKTP